MTSIQQLVNAIIANHKENALSVASDKRFSAKTEEVRLRWHRVCLIIKGMTP